MNSSINKINISGQEYDIESGVMSVAGLTGNVTSDQLAEAISDKVVDKIAQDGGVATEETAGFMSAEDKAKLDSISISVEDKTLILTTQSGN